MSFLVITPSAEQIQEARQSYTGQQFNQHTFKEDGAGQLVGTLAEICFRDYLDGKFIEHDYVASEMRPYDFVIANRRIDIKAKRRTVRMKPSYTVHVETRIKGLECDHYVFASVMCQDGEPALVEFVGWCPASKFWGVASGADVGHVDPDGFTAKLASHRVEAGKLLPMTKLFDLVELRLYQMAFGEA